MAFLTTLQNKRAKHTPIWLMRQAGRYQEVYRKLRAKHDLLSLVKDPSLACEITMQPINSFNLDAAIIFSDILPLLEGMGLHLEFLKGEGPRIHNPVSSKSDIDALTCISAQESMPYTLEAIKMVRRELEPKKLPLIGFSGSPFTLASYAIEGGPSKNYIKTKSMMYAEPESFFMLMEKLTKGITDYLVEQAYAGAQCLQLFDSWAGALAPSDYEQHVTPHIKNILKITRSKVEVPLLYFSTGTNGMLENVCQLPCDGVGIDWRIPIDKAAKIVGPHKVLQGNLDPVSLFAPWPVLKAKTKEVIDNVKMVRPNLEGYVFNLGHGILPQTPEKNVQQLCDFIHDYTAL